MKYFRLIIILVVIGVCLFVMYGTGRAATYLTIIQGESQ